jgi:hypothetical protein
MDSKELPKVIFDRKMACSVVVANTLPYQLNRYQLYAIGYPKKTTRQTLMHYPYRPRAYRSKSFIKWKAHIDMSTKMDIDI